METLTELLEQIIAEKTFTADALEGITALKQRATKLEENLVESENARKNLQKECDQLNNQISAKQSKINDQGELLRKAQSQIAEMAPAKYEAEKQKAIADTLKWTYETLFKPSETRRSVNGFAVVRTPTMQPNNTMGGGDCVQPQTTTETVTEL